MAQSILAIRGPVFCHVSGEVPFGFRDSGRERTLIKGNFV